MTSTLAGPLFDPLFRDYIPPDPELEEFVPPKDRASFADPEKKQLFAACSKVEHLTETIGTQLHGIQLSQLNPAQKDELALLVAERGVVFFRDQDLTTATQEEFFAHYGVLERHPAQPEVKRVDIRGDTEDWRMRDVFYPWPLAALHADASYELNPPAYALLRMEEHPPVGGDTLWTSQYGTYDELSKPMKTFVDGLKVVHTSWNRYQTIIPLWGIKPRRKPIDTEHPLVRTHPVTGLKALNYSPGYAVRVADLKKAESDKMIEFLLNHLNDSPDHSVRWRWEVGSCAMWDNRVTCHRVIPGKYKEARRGVRTTIFGERPYFDPKSEGRQEREERLAKESGQSTNGDKTKSAESETANGDSSVPLPQ